MGEGIQAGPEQNILSDAGGDGAAQVVFGIAAAGYEMRSHGDRKRPVFPRRSAPQLLGIRVSQDGNRDRIVKDHRAVMYLVRRPAESHAEGCPRWDSLLHSV